MADDLRACCSGIGLLGAHSDWCPALPWILAAEQRGRERQRAADEPLVKAAREMLRALERLTIALPRQAGKTAIHDAYHALFAAVEAAVASPEGPETP
jgi:hypothetical protein